MGQSQQKNRRSKKKKKLQPTEPEKFCMKLHPPVLTSESAQTDQNKKGPRKQGRHLTIWDIFKDGNDRW